MDTVHEAEAGPLPARSAQSEAPYPGLRAFTAEESNLFFGRDQQTEELLVRLDSAHLLAVLGASGCGKSSLVRAGLISQLEAGFMPSAGAHWQVAELRPGDEPFHRLAEQLVKKDVVARSAVDSEDVQIAVLDARLQQGPLALGEVLAERPGDNPPNLLVLVDQFEEIFRFHHERDSDQADAFVALLLATAQACESGLPWSRIYVALTMRSDFLGDCILFDGLTDAINRGLYVVPELQRDDLRLAIEGPAMLRGTVLDPALVSHLLNESGARSDQLPLLQHALMRLWHHAVADVHARDASGAVCLSLELYKQRLGSLGQALNDHADEVMQKVGDDALVQAIFTAITGRQGRSRDTRRPTRIRDVTALAGPRRYWQDIVRVVEEFRAPTHNFLQPQLPEKLEESTYLDIGHESLIRNWSRLAGWVRDEDELATELHRAVDAARLAHQARQVGQTPELWGPSGVERSRRWMSRDAVAVWAQRYVSREDYEQAVAFVRASEEDIAREAAEGRASRRRRAAAAAGVLVAATVGLLGWGYQLRQFNGRLSEANRQIKASLEESARQKQSATDARRDADNRIQQAEGKTAALEAEQRRFETYSKLREAGLSAKVAKANAEIDRAVSKRLVSDASAKEDADYALAATMEGLRVLPSEAARHELRRRHAVWPDDVRTPPPWAADAVVKMHEDGTVVVLRHRNAPIVLSPDLAPLSTGYRQEMPTPTSLAAVSSRPPRLLISRANGETGKTEFVREDYRPGGQTLRWTEDGTFRALQLDAAGQTLLSIDNEDRVRVRPVGERSATDAWSPTRRKYRYGIFHPRQPWVLLGDADGQLWAVGLAEPHDEVRLGQTSQRREVRSLQPVSGGSQLAVTTTSKPGTFGVDYLELWSWSADAVPALRMDRVVPLQPQESVRMAGSIVGIGGQQRLRAFDARNGWELLNWSSAAEGVTLRDFVVSPAGRLVSLWSDGQRRDFDLTGRQTLRSTASLAPEVEIKDASFGPDRDRVTFTVGPLPVSASTRLALRALDTLDLDGLWVARGDSRDTIAIVDVRAQRVRNRVLVGGSATVTATALDRGARHLAVGYLDGSVALFNAIDGSPMRLIRPNDGTRISALSLSGNGTLLAWGDFMGNVGGWDWGTGVQFTASQRHGDTVRDVAVSPDGNLIASGGDDRRLRLWTLLAPSTPKARSSERSPGSGLLAELTYQGRVPEIHEDWVMAVAFSPDGKQLLTGADDGQVRLWNLADGRFSVLTQLPDGVRTLALSADGRSAAVATGTVLRWLNLKGEASAEFAGEAAARPAGLRLDAQGRLTALDMNRQLRLWTVAGEAPDRLDLNALDPLLPLGWRSYTADLNSPVASAELLPGLADASNVQVARANARGDRLVTLEGGGLLRVIDLGSGAVVHTTTLPKGATVVAISPDGRRVAAGFDNGMLIGVTVGNERMVRRDIDGANRITALAFNADGSQLASVAGGQEVQVSAADTLAHVRTLKHRTNVRDVVSLRGASGVEWLTTEGDRMSGWLRDPSAAPREWVTNSLVSSASASPDGNLLVTTEAGSVRLYNLRWGSTTLTPQALVGTVGRPTAERPVRASFSADGRRVLTLLANGTVRDLPCRMCLSQEELKQWGLRTARPLTPEERDAARRLVVE